MPNGELPVSLEIVNQDSDMITGDTIQNRIQDFTNESFWSLKENRKGNIRPGIITDPIE
tara:strand:- start:182 stop:358 length:177 start_codon:yes stop_codon:yes gene_type:complete